jgi:hypothetical protein
MIYLIEGARNSGKTFITSFFKESKDYKFPFTRWFGDLGYNDEKKETHDFALGKEIMLLDLNKKGFIEEMICDRGIITVFVWAVLSGRISEQRALEELNLVIKDGLFDNVKILWVKGKNPDQTSRNKDFWDRREQEREKEHLLFNSFLGKLKGDSAHIDIKEIENTFDEQVKSRLEEIKNVWNIN